MAKRQAITSLLTLAVVLVGAAAGLAACSSLMARPPISQAAQENAVVPGLVHVRFWGDEVPSDAGAVLRQRLPSLGKPPQATHFENGRPVVHYLALSGGGSNGAFGAGLLVGWTKSGTRPTFEFVTGISAGALIAPFAFLGSAYDRQLEELWTKFGDEDLLPKQPLAVVLGGVALADPQPLADLIAQYIDRKLLAAIAAEYRKGRILLVGTTNIDAKRPVVWNMGEIAISSNPRALQLFREVLLASASIPGALPPVPINVDADGQLHDEYHVDGGVTRQVFLAPLALSLTEFDKFYSAPPIRRIYVVRNGSLKPRFELTQPNAASLATNSITTLLNAEAAGDIYRIFAAATRDGAEFRLAAIPPALEPSSMNIHGEGYAQRLFQAAKNEAAGGYPWLKTPPELHPSSLQGRNASR